MEAYKGFNENLQCMNNFQYEIGKSYDEPKADLCHAGFHACEYPLDVFGHFEPATSRYCEVEMDGVSTQREENDSKVCGTHIEIKAEISIVGIINAAVAYIKDHIDGTIAQTNTGDQSAATNTSNWSAATNTGYRSAATNTGNRSAATNTGDWSAATNTGNRSAATNTGNQSAATNTGDRSAATNTGDQSAATNTGDRSAATNTGYQSAASVEGKESIAIATGYRSKAKGAMGCYIVLAERANDGHIVCVKSHIVDGKTIKADTFYTLTNGKFREVKEKRK